MDNKIIKLEFDERLVEGRIIEVIETYADTDYTGYEVLKVAGNIVVEENGQKYVPAKMSDNMVTHWKEKK